MLMGDAMLSSLFRKEVFSSKMKSQDGVSARRESNADVGGDFRVFRDYLGLANLIIPGGFQPRFEADLDDFVLCRREFSLDLSFLETQHRHRMNSLDSDALSETSSCSRSDSESFDSLAQEVPPTYGTIHMSPFLESSLHSLDPVLANRKASIARPFDLPQQQQQQQQSKDGRRNASKASVCVFCRNNGESREFYSSHTLKDNEGNTACPILRAYTCPLCKANGDHSHTIKYCPKYTPKQKVEKPFGLI